MRKFLSLLLSFLFLSSFGSVNAFAMESTSLSNEDLIVYTQSEQVKDIITDNIDLSKEGTQLVNVGNGLAFELTLSTSKSKISTFAAYSTKTGSASGRFYRVDNNETVANYSLSATFEYDGKTYVGLSKSPTQTQSTVDSNWRLDGICEELATDTQYIVSGQWTLYQKVGLIWKKYEYNNDAHIDIQCTPKGIITYNYK